MILLYRSKDRMEAALLRGMLEKNGIFCRTSGGAASIGFGELSADALLVDLWVAEDDAGQARLLIEEHLSGGLGQGPDWICSRCGEANASSFDLCWGCQEPGPAG